MAWSVDGMIILMFTMEISITFKWSGTLYNRNQAYIYYRNKSHEMDSLWGSVRNSGGHIITLF